MSHHVICAGATNDNQRMQSHYWVHADTAEEALDQINPLWIEGHDLHPWKHVVEGTDLMRRCNEPAHQHRWSFEL